MYHVVHVPHGTLEPMRKQDLLEAVVAELARGGIGDRSLREIGAAVGTSHRMLIHYFGSREGLLTEVVRHRRGGPAALPREPRVDPGARSWPRPRSDVAAPQRPARCGPPSGCSSSATRGPARGEAPFASLLPGLVDDWLDLTVRLRLVWPGDERTERARARAGLAMFRGLLLDLVGTEDRDRRGRCVRGAPDLGHRPAVAAGRRSRLISSRRGIIARCTATSRFAGSSSCS